MERELRLRRLLALILGFHVSWVSAASLPATGSESVASWDGAVATYNMVSTPGAEQAPSVFIPATREVETSDPPPAKAPLEELRAAAVPAPLAWWLLMAGLVGVVGISRRRNVQRSTAR